MGIRQFRRVILPMPVVLFYRPIGLIRGKIINVCRSGMCVDTGLMMLAPNAIVDICFVYPRADERFVFRFNGKVCYCEDSRIGLLFQDLNLVLPDIP